MRHSAKYIQVVIEKETFDLQLRALLSELNVLEYIVASPNGFQFPQSDMAIFEKTPACKTRNHWIYLTENTKTCRMRGRARLGKSLHVLDLTGVYFHPKINEYSEKVCLLTGRRQTRSSSLVARETVLYKITYGST